MNGDNDDNDNVNDAGIPDTTDNGAIDNQGSDNDSGGADEISDAA